MNTLNNQLPKPFIICGDTNAHSPHWNCKNWNKKGRISQNVVDNYNLIKHNYNNSLSHYSFSYKTLSNIDLIISDVSVSETIQ